MPAYTVREWDKLAYGEGEGQIPARHADRLADSRRVQPLLAAAGAGCLSMAGMPCAHAAWSGF